MFDALGSLAGVDDSALVDAITAGDRAEAMAASARLTAIGELVARRCGDQGDREWWACDGWDAAAAEVGAALTVGRRGAARQMHLAMSLRTRLPKVAAQLATGVVSVELVSAICWHTALVEDSDVIALLDTALAGAMLHWGRLSSAKVASLIDVWVEKFDPVAVRRTRGRARSRTVEFGKPEDGSGVVTIWGALLATDAAVLKARLSAMAAQVCREDPRTIGQRCADALGALAAGSDRLTCLCGHADCEAAAVPDARAGAVVIHVLAESAPTAVTAAESARVDPMINGPFDSRPVDLDAQVAEALAPESQPPAPVDQSAVGHVLGGPVLPAVLLADLIARGATVRTVASLAGLAEHPGYRPPKALDEFVRMRDMTCTFPGCDHPAVAADIDHTVPWPAGATHPGNNKCLCRKHHLLKTFYGGLAGWRDVQEPDGTVVWTAPTGHVYQTVPGARILFPDRDFRTPPPSASAGQANLDQLGRGVMMPTRRRTRADDRAAGIAYERRLNQEELEAASGQGEKPSAPSASHDRDQILAGDEPDPPPF